MKKTLLFASLSALILAGCSKNKFPENPEGVGSIRVSIQGDTRQDTRITGSLMLRLYDIRNDSNCRVTGWADCLVKCGEVLLFEPYEE